MSCFYTTDYEDFGHPAENQTRLSPKEFEAKKQSILADGFFFQPAIVIPIDSDEPAVLPYQTKEGEVIPQAVTGRKYLIIEGNNRMQIAREEGLPIPVFVNETLTRDHMVNINTDKKELDNENYITMHKIKYESVKFDEERAATYNNLDYYVRTWRKQGYSTASVIKVMSATNTTIIDNMKRGTYNLDPNNQNIFLQAEQLRPFIGSNVNHNSFLSHFKKILQDPQGFKLKYLIEGLKNKETIIVQGGDMNVSEQIYDIHDRYLPVRTGAQGFHQDVKDRVWHASKGICAVSGITVPWDDKNYHHHIPVAQGGESSFENCRLTNRTANLSESDKMPLF